MATYALPALAGVLLVPFVPPGSLAGHALNVVLSTVALVLFDLGTRAPRGTS